MRSRVNRGSWARGGWVLGLLLVVSLSAPISSQEDPGDAAESGVWDDVERLYESAKEAGERVPKNIYDWIRADIEHLGDWEYRVVELETSDAKSAEGKLNELGQERWECIWVQTSGKTTRFYLKRPVRSYLKTLPLSQLLKLIPSGSD